MPRPTSRSARSFAPFLLLASLASVGTAACAADGAAGEVDATLFDDDGVSPQGPPLPGGPLVVEPSLSGRVRCAVPDGATRVTLPVAGLPVTIAGRTTTTDANGQFSFRGSFAGAVDVRLTYEGPITSSGVTTPLQIMNDLKETRTATVRRTVVGPTIFKSVGDLDVATLDCELFRLGGDVLRDFHAVRGAPPPAGRLRIQRWNDIRVAAHAFYDYVNISPDWLDSATTVGQRRGTLTHEFGHSIRHVADGPQHHWDWDNFRWAYARAHRGDEIFNVQYAFNEGWASYWERVRTGAGPFTDTIPAGNLHWNEQLVANRLMQLSDRPGVGPRGMLAVLEASPGIVHRLHDFESRLNARLGRPAPAPQPECPPGFTDDGATCRGGGEVVAKPSFGRGVGTPPTVCGAGQELDAGLCYPTCRAGFDGVGPVCWQTCPAGFQDDGAFCRRDGQIVNATNTCPWWDACGLTTNRGCSFCPDDTWQHDGCTCRRDPHIFAKASFGRGVGGVPTTCAPGAENDAGLCYPACRAGFDGVGPVCWGTCPAGFDDDGATCRRPLAILVKY